jgi:hypothetical protein
MTVRSGLRSLVALLVAVVALVAGAANGATAAPAAVGTASAVISTTACTPSPPPPPAPGMGTAVIRLDRGFVTTLARAGVVVYATSPAGTSLCISPLATQLTFPLHPTELGAGTVTAAMDGRLVFRQLGTGATLSLGIRTFWHQSVGSYILSDQQLPLGQTVVFSVGQADPSGAYSLGFPNPDLINGPLGVDVAASGPVGTVTTSYPA